MMRWVVDIEPVSDLLEAWTNAFHDPQRAYDAFWRSPIKGEGFTKTIDQMQQRIMHFWNNGEPQLRQQGPDAIHSLDHNLLQRGQTWRTKLEMLAVANSNRRKLWPGHPEGEAHHLEWAKRPKPYVKLEKLTKPHQHHAFPTA